MATIVRRNLEGRVRSLARRFPVVTVTGPRQSGKTTLCRQVFPGLPYANLETPEVREAARIDPRGFLAQFPRGAVLDEVQRAPDLLSYIQVLVDEPGRRGRWVLTGSQHFGLLEGISQSLAGRTAVVQLLPLALDEVRRFPRPRRGLWDVLWSGGYPRIHQGRVPPSEWLTGYVATYLERDVQQVARIGDLQALQTFLRLCAGRAGQVLNLAALGADCGITQPTARAWLTVLETSFLVYRLPPLHRNLRKRLTRSPKLYFYDSGLLCYLLGVREPAQLETHPHRGAVFESWAVSEILKARANLGLPPDAFFYRDHRGEEVDLVLEGGSRALAVEIKSGRTVAQDFFAALDRFSRLLEGTTAWKPRLERRLIYGGEGAQDRLGVKVVPWSRIAELDWSLS